MTWLSLWCNLRHFIFFFLILKILCFIIFIINKLIFIYILKFLKFYRNVLIYSSLIFILALLLKGQFFNNPKKSIITINFFIFSIFIFDNFIKLNIFIFFYINNYNILFFIYFFIDYFIIYDWVYILCNLFNVLFKILNLIILQCNALLYN